jgi:hypothetical protein
MTKDNWPTFFIVGAPRSGTTSLYNYLKTIPEIFMSPVKEPGYFIPNDFRGFTEKKYLDLFKNIKNEIVIGEASAGYLANREASLKIKKQIPDAKIIITLRDPVERTFSDYLNNLRTGNVKRTFEQDFENFLRNNKEQSHLKKSIPVSMFFEQVKNYLNIFGKENVKVLIFEETIKDTKKAIEDVLEFLGVQTQIPENFEKQYNAYSEPLGSFGTNIAKNKTISTIVKKIFPNKNRENILHTILNKKGKKPKMSEEIKIKLQNLFLEDVKKLEKLLERPLPWPTIKENSERKIK